MDFEVLDVVAKAPFSSIAFDRSCCESAVAGWMVIELQNIHM